MPKRVLILGGAGVEKRYVLRQLATYRKDRTDATFVGIDFEHEFVLPIAKEFHVFLDGTTQEQVTIWEHAWNDLIRKTADYGQSDVLLALHGVLVRPLYGLRSPVSFEQIKQFEPTHIVTLIDDVYMQWHRTQTRARKQRWRGMPSLEQLIEQRRAEILFGDLLARNLSPSGELRNFVVAVRHPARLLDRLIFHSDTSQPIYLSFPISGPRTMQAAGDLSGIAEVNRLLLETARFEQGPVGVAFQCPLSIDELPLARLLRDDSTPGDVTFDMGAHRWNVREFWPEPEILLTEESPQKLTLRREQIEEALGLIRVDVKLRDYRLVMQSKRIAVLNPWFNGEDSRGVRNEIACALLHRIPVHIYQDPNHGSPAEVERVLTSGGPVGALGPSPYGDYVVFHDSLNDLLRALREEV